MLSTLLVTAGIVLCLVSGVPSLLVRRTGAASTLLIVIGGLTGLAGSIVGLFGQSSTLSLPWQVPGGAIVVRIDALSAFFAAPVFLLAAAGGLYAERYWPSTKGRSGYVRALFGLMSGALALVISASSTILFLAAWEIVAVTSFLLIAVEDERQDSRAAAWIYLASSHVATLALFGLVALLHATTGGWSFAALPDGIAATSAGQALLWLAAIAFGMKAGVMPLHIWLPGAHAAAPTHVSALMSGVAIKMGIYGLVRLLSLFDAVPSSFGLVLLVAGMVSSVLGVAFALVQHDLKRLLAYHSIENIGIIVTGLGIGVVAQANGQPRLALLGYAGALLHVWNHGLFKALLFLSAGSAIQAAHTREIDRMGGLARRMPWTSAAFLAGAAAISGLPPFNGFVSEWLLYLAGFTSMTTATGSAASLLLILVVPALAVTGALALACFVKAFGAVFLGEPRSSAAAQAVEAPRTMRMAMLPLVAACLAIGVFPAVFAPVLVRTIRVAVPPLPAPAGLGAMLQPVQTAAIVILTVVVAVIALLLRRTRRAPRVVTWDCGYAAPTARMQYTSSSFARGLAGLFAWVMPPVVRAPRKFTLFPRSGTFESHVPDTVLDRGLLPVLGHARRVVGFARYLQHGRMQLYLLYLALTLVALLAWSAR